MMTGIGVLLTALLAAVFVVKSATAIHCVQCSNCPDTEEIPSPRNCSRITFFDEFRKMVPGGTASGNMGGRAVSCFKMIVRHSDKETVSRGCSGEVKQYECSEIVDKVELCACAGDGCNSAALPIVPIALIAASLLLSVAVRY